MFLPDYVHGSYETAVLLKLLLAALAGGIIGLEREKHGRPAGLRTHLLVSVGSCLMMIVSEGFYLKYGHEAGTLALRIDPSRVAAQIVAGIGFLGAGVIIKEGISIRGLTTAASLWLVAGLGMSFGIGLYGPGILSAAIALFSLIGLKRLEPVIKKDRYLHLDVITAMEPDIYPDLERLFEERGLRISDISSEIDLDRREIHYHFVLTQHRKRMGRELSTVIARIPGVKKIGFK